MGGALSTQAAACSALHPTLGPLLAHDPVTRLCSGHKLAMQLNCNFTLFKCFVLCGAFWVLGFRLLGRGSRLGLYLGMYYICIWYAHI